MSPQPAWMVTCISQKQKMYTVVKTGSYTAIIDLPQYFKPEGSYVLFYMTTTIQLTHQNLVWEQEHTQDHTQDEHR